MNNIDTEASLFISLLNMLLILTLSGVIFASYISLGFVFRNFFLKKLKLNFITTLIVDVLLGAFITSLVMTLAGIFKINYYWVSILFPVLSIGFINKQALFKLFNKIKKVSYFYLRSDKSYYTYVIAFFLFILLVRALAPVVDWDTAVYHIPVIQKFIEQNAITSFVHEDMFNTPMTFQVLLSPYIALKMYSGVQVLNFCLLLFLIITFHQLCKKIGFKQIFPLALFILAANPLVFNIISSGRLELFLTLLTAANFLIFINLIKKPQAELIYLGGFFCLFSIAIKVTGIAIGVIFGLVYLLFALKHFKLIKPGIRQVFLFQIALLPIIIWYGKSMVAFENPFYPYFQQDIHSTLEDGQEVPLYNTAKKILTSCEYIDKTNKELSYWVHTVKNAAPFPSLYTFGIYDLIFNQDAFVKKWVDKYCPLTLLFLLPFWIRRKNLILPSVVILILFLVFLTNSTIIRYCLPIFPLLALLAAINISLVFEKVSPRCKKFLSTIIMIFCICYIAISQYSMLTNENYRLMIKYLTGEVSLSKFTEDFNLKTTFASKIFNFLDKKYPRDQGAMLIAHSRTMYLNRPYVADYDGARRQLIPWIRLVVKYNDDAEKIYQDLLQRNMLHIVVEYSTLLRTVQEYRMLEKEKAWIRKYDKCDPELMAISFISLGNFLNNYTDETYSDKKRKLASFKLKDPRKIKKNSLIEGKTCNSNRNPN